jgi:uncharacterized membrane protein YgcG
MMASPRRTRKSSAPQKNGVRAPAANLALPYWRWLIYLGVGGIIFCVIFVKIGGVIPDKYASLDAWRESDALGNLAISGVFTGLIVGLIKLFFDPVFLGIAQRKSTLSIAEDLALSVAKVAAGVVIEGVLDAAASSASGGDSGSGDFKGGGGSFGGGGASGDF